MTVTIAHRVTPATDVRGRRAGATLGVLALALALAGCGNDGEAAGMTQDEAYEKLRSDFEAAVEAVAPGIEGPVFDHPPMRDTPCGGPVGTDRTRVTSSLFGLVGRADWDGDVDATAERLSTVAQERGYELSRGTGDRITFTFATSGQASEAFVFSFAATPQGDLTLSGATPCLPADGA